MKYLIGFIVGVVSLYIWFTFIFTGYVEIKPVYNVCNSGWKNISGKTLEISGNYMVWLKVNEDKGNLKYVTECSPGQIKWDVKMLVDL